MVKHNKQNISRTGSGLKNSRRKFMKMAGGAVGAGGLLGLSSVAEAAEKPDMRWVPAHYTNYTSANRDPSDVDYIVIHTLEGPYEENVRYFERNNSRNVSAHFVVSYQGEITKMVNVDDIAHTQYPFNSNSIGIEMEGYAAQDDVTDAMYKAVAKLTRYLAEKWNVDKVHPDGLICGGPSSGIIGHNQIPNSNCTGARYGKTDPGPYWDWNYFMGLVKEGGKDPAFEIGQDVVSTDAVNVRSSAEIKNNVKHTQPKGKRGTIANGYVTNEGFVWWWVEWENGVGGWSVQKYLEAAGEKPAFSIGERVKTTANLVVHEGAALDSPNVDVEEEGTRGTVKNGYITEDGYTWWKIRYEDGDLGWSVQKYLKSVEGSLNNFTIDTSLRRTVDVTGAELDDAIRAEKPGSPLIGLGDDAVEVQNDLNINAVYIVAHAALESAWGTSEIARDKNNLFGWDARDSCPYKCADTFDSYEDCLRTVMGYIDEQYLDPNGSYYEDEYGPTLRGMNVHYASDNEWAEKIASVADRLLENL